MSRSRPASSSSIVAMPLISPRIHRRGAAPSRQRQRTLPLPILQRSAAEMDCPFEQLGIAAHSGLCSNGGVTQRPKSASGSEQTALLRQLPSVDELLLRPRVAALTGILQRHFVVEIVRGVLAQLRREIVSGTAASESDCSSEAIEQHIVAGVEK